MTIERLKELEASLARAYSISGDPELVDVNKHAECYGDIQKLIDAEIERQSVTDEGIQEAIKKLSEYLVFPELYTEKWIKTVNLAIQALQLFGKSEHVGNGDKSGCKCEQAVCLNGTAYCANCRRKL